MFRFKQFSVEHDKSAMKVGVDGVLIGCWADTQGASRILDVGCGCGLISLIMAQRCPQATVVGIDIDPPSVEEAKGNVDRSPWRERVEIVKMSYPNEVLACGLKGFDLIVSNPPYFNAGIADAATRREKARHQGALSPVSLIRHSQLLLRDGGNLAIVIPSEEYEEAVEEARRHNLSLARKCRVRGHENAPWKRWLLQWRSGMDPDNSPCLEESLSLEIAPGIHTDDYRQLCKDFYLKF